MDIFVTQLQRGACLKFIFSFSCSDNDTTLVASEDFNINNLAVVRFQFHYQKNSSGNIIHSLSWKKHELVPSLPNSDVRINIRCEQLDYSQELKCTSDWSAWMKMGELTKQTTQQPQSMNASNVTLIVTEVEPITFKNLFLETDFCDFRLKTVDSSSAYVPIHKACISLHSEVFKRMFHGESKENLNGCIEIKGVTMETLQEFKEYIYLGILPPHGLLQPLLLLAKCYMVKSLMTECITKLALNVKPEDLYALQEFAVDNKIPELIQAIVQITPDITIQIAHQMENDKGSKHNLGLCGALREETESRATVEPLRSKRRYSNRIHFNFGFN